MFAQSYMFWSIKSSEIQSFFNKSASHVEQVSLTVFYVFEC